jgi:hypothetical protein
MLKEVELEYTVSNLVKLSRDKCRGDLNRN